MESGSLFPMASPEVAIFFVLVDVSSLQVGAPQKLETGLRKPFLFTDVVPDSTH